MTVLCVSKYKKKSGETFQTFPADWTSWLLGFFFFGTENIFFFFVVPKYDKILSDRLCWCLALLTEIRIVKKAEEQALWCVTQHSFSEEYFQVKWIRHCQRLKADLFALFYSQLVITQLPCGGQKLTIICAGPRAAGGGGALNCAGRGPGAFCYCGC